MLDRRLTPRSSHDGKLTHRACKKYEQGTCADWELTEYDLSDATVRKELNDLSFICKLSGKRYKVCMDQAGFCRITYDCNFFQKIFGGCEKKVSFVSATPYQFLIDANLVCFSEKVYDWEEVQ